MKKTSILILFAFLAGIGVGILVWQQWLGARLNAENARLREEAGKAAQLAAENARLARQQVEPGELERLRDGQSELLRLRGQVSQLRREAEEARAAAASARAAAQVAATGTPTASPKTELPVTTYTANAAARLAWRTTAATGGWPLPSGKRGYVLLTPTEAGDGSINIRALVAHVPESLLVNAGLDNLKADGTAGGGSSVLTAEQLQVLTSSFRKKEGVELSAGPQISLLSGHSGQISSTEQKTLPSGETYFTGQIIDVTPTLTPDKQGVDLVVGAQVNLPRNQP